MRVNATTLMLMKQAPTKRGTEIAVLTSSIRVWAAIFPVTVNNSHEVVIETRMIEAMHRNASGVTAPDHLAPYTNIMNGAATTASPAKAGHKVPVIIATACI